MTNADRLKQIIEGVKASGKNEEEIEKAISRFLGSVLKKYMYPPYAIKLFEEYNPPIFTKKELGFMLMHDDEEEFWYNKLSDRYDGGNIDDTIEKDMFANMPKNARIRIRHMKCIAKINKQL